MNVTNSDINSFVDTVEAIKTECEKYLNECMEYHRQTSDLKDDFEMTAITQEEIEELKEEIDAKHQEIAAYYKDIPKYLYINNSLKREIETLHENTKLKNFWANCFLSVSIFVMVINCVLLVVS